MTVFSAARITSYDLPKPSWQGWQTPIHGLFLYGLQDKNGFYILKKNGFYIFKWWGGSAPQMRLKPVGGEVGLRTPSPPPALTPPPPHHAWHLSYVPGKRERSQEELSRTTEMSRLLLEGPPKGQGASRPLAPRPTLALEPAPQSFWKGPCLPPGEFRESF